MGSILRVFHWEPKKPAFLRRGWFQSSQNVHRNLKTDALAFGHHLTERAFWMSEAINYEAHDACFVL